MVAPRFEVTGPVALPPGYTLYDAAEVVTDSSAHWRTGVEYFSTNCLDAYTWYGMCEFPPDVERTVTVTFTGARTGTDPDFTYTLSAAATVDTGPARQITITVDGTPTTITTGAAATVVRSAATAGTYAVSATDVATGASDAGSITQSAADGSLTGDTVLTIPIADPTPRDPKRTEDGPWEYLTADTFTVYADVACNVIGFDEASRRAVDALEANTSRAVERYVWNTIFANATDYVEPAGDAQQDPVTAVAILLDYIANNYSGLGMLHAPRYGMPTMARFHQILRQDNNAFAVDGTPWAFGRGYSRINRASTGTGTTFGMYATGAVKIIQSPVDIVHEVFTPATNVRMAIAERSVTVLYDCMSLVGVNVTGGLL